MRVQQGQDCRTVRAEWLLQAPALQVEPLSLMLQAPTFAWLYGRVGHARGFEIRVKEGLKKVSRALLEIRNEGLRFGFEN